ncbi:MAG: pyridoxal phosphate-dependent aminotransferase [Myxococcota bacterium]
MPSFPDVSSTTESLVANVYTPLSGRIARHEGPMYRLQIGDTWLDPLPAARAEAIRSADHPGLHRYAPVQGEPALLDAVVERLAERTGITVPREAVQVTQGATSGLAVLCQAVLDPGDEVLLPSPYWPLIRGIIAGRGGEPVEIPTWTRLDDPDFDLEAALEAAVTPRTAAVYVNSPHNPTGRVLDEAQTAAIARVAERHGLWILSDEVYEDLWYGDEAPRPFWAHPDVRGRCLAAHSLSKAYGLAGARIGWVHGPADAMRVVQSVHTFQAYCAARPMQLAGVQALRGGDAWLARARGAYRDAGRKAAEVVGQPAPEGGTFLFFDASPWLEEGADATPFLARCIDEGLVLTHGRASGRAYGSWVRLCYTAVPPDDLDAALEGLRRVVGT